MASGQRPESRLLRTLRRLDVGRLADAAMAGAVMALLLAMVLGKAKLPVIGALFSLCVVLVLLLLASYDLVVRWAELDLDGPDRRGPAVQKVWLRLLRYAWPEVVLVAGMIVGHVLWKG
jgi:hypothetical protein